MAEQYEKFQKYDLAEKYALLSIEKFRKMILPIFGNDQLIDDLDIAISLGVLGRIQIIKGNIVEGFKNITAAFEMRERLA